MRSRQKTFTIISIATNIYFEYWCQMVISLLDSSEEQSDLRIVLFTDQVKSAEEFASKLDKKVNFEFFEIPNYKWPEATLLRYEILSKEFGNVEGDIFIYIDADMKVRRDLLSEIRHLKLNRGMYFALHPGYVLKFPGLNFALVQYSIRAILRLFSSKHRGAWERDPRSTAYIPFGKRKRYLHGAFWFGEKEAFFSFVRKCANNVKQDSQQNLVANWHDESHLNAYYVRHGGNILPTRFSWHRKYAKFLEANPVVESVDNLGKTR